MRITDAIAELKDILDEEGDLEVVCLTDVDTSFCIEHGRVFEVILPEGAEDLVCAYMEPELFEDGPHLKLVQ